MTFYEIKDKEELQPIEYSDDVEVFGPVKCPEYDGHQRAQRLSNVNLKIKIKKGFRDFNWTWFSDCIITDEVALAFKKAEFTGFILKPVQVESKVKELPIFWELDIIGKGGDASPESGIYLKYECPYCGHKRYSAFENGIIVNEKNWDGSDFFTVTGYPKYFLVTQKVVDLIREHNFCNVKITPSNEVKWPESLSKPE